MRRQQKALKGPYKKYTSKDRAEVANYTSLHGTSAAVRHFKVRFSDLKWTTVNDWKVLATMVSWRRLLYWKRNRPLLPDSVTANKKYLKGTFFCA
jgi:hypothetical protein